MRMLLSLLILLIHASALASVNITQNTDTRINVTADTTYLLGENDTIQDARTIALAKVKQAIAERIGTVVQHEQFIQNDVIQSESLTILSAALIEIRNMDERLAVSSTAQNRMDMHLTVHATVDKAAFRNNVERLRQNRDLKEMIERLQAENTQLQQQFTTLSEQISRSTSRPASSNASNNDERVLLRERANVIERIANTQEAVQQAFERGAVFTIAQRQHEEVLRLEREIYDNLITYIMENIELTVREPLIRMQADGTYDVEIIVDFEVDHEPIFHNVIQQHYDVNNGFRLNRYSQANAVVLTPQHQTLSDILYQQRIVIVVQLNEHRKQDFLIYGEARDRRIRFGEVRLNDAATPPIVGHPIAIIYRSNTSQEHKTGISFMDNKVLKTPIVFTGVSEQELREITTITATVELRKYE